jgi:hypothetical protein
MMTLEKLRALLDSGAFHHATYRNEGTLWEGLWIYKKMDQHPGYVPDGAFFKDSPHLDEAHKLVRHTGVSVGAFGRG